MLSIRPSSHIYAILDLSVSETAIRSCQSTHIFVRVTHTSSRIAEMSYHRHVPAHLHFQYDTAMHPLHRRRVDELVIHRFMSIAYS